MVEVTPEVRDGWIAAAREAEQRVAELRHIVAALMGGDDKMTVAIGGNPNYVERFMENARAVLERTAK